MARVLPIPYLVAQHVQHGGQNVDLACQPLDPLAALEPARRVDEQRYPQSLLVGVVTVYIAAVLAEALAMVAVDDEDGVLVEPQLLVLLKEVLQKVVQHAQAVVVTVELLVLRAVLV